MPSHRHVVLASLLPLMLAGVSWAQPAGALPADTRHLAGGEVCDPILPVLTGLPDGGFAAAWIDGRVHSGVFDRRAARVGPQAVSGTPEGRPGDPQIAVSPSGRIAVGWLEADGPHVQIFESDGRPRTPDLELGGPVPFHIPGLPADTDELEQIFDLVADPTGGFLALWGPGSFGARIGEDGEIGLLGSLSADGLQLFQRDFRAVLHPHGTLWWIDFVDPPITPPLVTVRVLRSRLGDSSEAEELLASIVPNRQVAKRTALAIDGRGRVLAVWSQPGGIFAQRFAASGERLGETVTVATEDLEARTERLYSLDLATDAEGNFAVVWGQFLSEAPGSAFTSSTLLVRGFGSDGSALGPAREVVSAPFSRLLSPRVAVSGPGEVTVAWWRETILPILPPDCSFSETIFARRIPLAGDSTLLLGDGRFRVDVRWEDPFNGGGGVGHAIPDTPDSGGFWFFDPDNTELKVKVIDGRAVNGRFWFFYGALSNVEYRITVTDQRTGLSKTYDNPPGVFGSFADTFAFPATD